MTLQTGNPHPVTKKSAHQGLARLEPIAIAITAAVVFAIISFVVSSQDDLTVSEAVTHIGTIAAMIAGGNWARNRVVSVESFDKQTDQIARDARASERTLINEELARNVEEFSDMEEAFDPDSFGEF